MQRSCRREILNVGPCWWNVINQRITDRKVGGCLIVLAHLRQFWKAARLCGEFLKCFKQYRLYSVIKWWGGSSRFPTGFWPVQPQDSTQLWPGLLGAYSVPAHPLPPPLGFCTVRREKMSVMPQLLLNLSALLITSFATAAISPLVFMESFCSSRKDGTLCNTEIKRCIYKQVGLNLKGRVKSSIIFSAGLQNLSCQEGKCFVTKSRQMLVET